MCKPSSLSKELLSYENIIITSTPKAKKYIKQFENGRTPLSKRKSFRKLTKLIKDIITYNTKDTSGIYAVDDTTPLLMFYLIKASPEKYSSNIVYLEMFLDLFEQQDNSIFTTLNAPILLLENVNVDVFKGIKDQCEFDKELEKALSKSNESPDANEYNNYY